MIRKIISTSLLLGLFTLSGKSISQSADAALSQHYFGETPPSLVPKLFDPKIVSPDGRFEGGMFNPDMAAFYFTRKNGKYKKRTFFVVRYDNGRWGEVVETDIRWPQFSSDGSVMHLGKQYRELTAAGWSELKSLGAFIKEQGHGLSVSAKGTYYFPFYKKQDNGHGNIGYSQLINGKYQDPIKLGPQINTGEWIAHPYIAPDESYLMWDVVRDVGHGGSDIYISFKNSAGEWLPAINMGEHINTDSDESSPWVSHDGKYLFFSRGDWHRRKDGSKNWVGKSYWVDAKVIENLRPKL
ncbi:PD40 domain-containing protein [Pseudoalteromonas byunsanensis]|uniref:Uncharacterized protein n=1 Tax=Pseudoalteromonas byunsanensis TaxID=327939 RepID=A0A1S1N7I2_9GAMM|nr:PD40 domain-containing protein [Pseudoalteromonas byunsanensis]OHU95967.1 hypothetical protein BIW53_09190 [Pseudoalteromonas byunsanensis]